MFDQNKLHRWLFHAPFAGLIAALLFLQFPLTTSGQTVVAWGLNSQGQINVPASATNVVQVAAGWNHSLALRADGSVISWGAITSVPAEVTNVTTIAAGAAHSVAVRADGSVVAWGSNSFGQSNVPTEATNVVALAVGNYHNLVMRGDGTLIAWGKNDFGQTSVPATLSNVVSISAGAEHSMALTIDGQVVVWGGSSTAPLNAVTNSFAKSINDTVAVSAGAFHNLGLRADGRVFLWGNLTTMPPTPTLFTNIVAVAAATNFNLALRADGRLFSWGTGTVTNVAATVTNVISFAAGGGHAVALRGNGAPRLFGGPAYRRISSVGDALPLFARVGGSSNWVANWYTNGALATTVTNQPRPQLPTPLSANVISYQVVVTNSFGAVTSTLAQVSARMLNIWGDNFSGQREIPTGLMTLLAVAAGAFHNLALQADGTVVAWGKNTDGQTNVPPSATNIVALAGGSYHGLALTDDGKVLAWGRNWDGQTNVPPEATNVVAIGAGYAHSLALRADGVVVAWGNNEFGQGAGSFLAQDVVAIAAGYYHNLALRADGRVIAWGYDGQLTGFGLSDPVPAAATNVVAIAAGWSHSLALRADGTVLAWGDNTHGQSAVPSNATNVVAIAAGWYHSVALRADGTVLVWGQNAYGIASPPTGLLNASQIATGEGHGLALVNWGVPSFSSRSQQIAGSAGGQAVLALAVQTAYPASFQWFHDGALIVGATNQHLVLPGLQTSASGNYVLAATNAVGGSVSQPINLVVQPQPATFTTVGVWGDNLSGQRDVPPGLVNPRAVAAGAFHNLALQGDGTVVAWGKNADGQTNVPPNLTNVVAIAAGGNHSLALQAGGNVVAWGRNWDGQTNVPPAATNVIAIGAGSVHSVALKADGSLLAWGGNNHGQTQLPNVTNEFIAIAAGYFHTLALRADHQVIAWGSRATVPAAVSNVVAIAAGWEHSLALRADGSVWAWGDDSYGQCQVPAVATNIVAIAAGYGYSVAQRADGAVLSWGTGVYGVTNVPWALRNVGDIVAGENHTVALVEQGPARFERLPRAVSAHVGGAAVLDAEVRGSERLFGQWLHDGAPVLNATNRQLLLAQLQPTNAGDYVFVVSNAVSTSSSAPVALAVLATPEIATEPRQLNHPPALPLHLAAVAHGAPPLRYQWRFNGADLPETVRISGTQTEELAINATTYADSGDFSLVVSNVQGMVTSLVAQVLITPVIAWGDNAARQLQIPVGLTDIVAVSAGGEHSLALHVDGSVVAWGDNSAGQTNVPGTVQNAIAIAAGGTHSVALLADGRVIAWGDNTNGQCNVPAGATNMIAIAAGETQTVGLRNDGVALLWGKYFGQPNFSIGIATNAIAVSAFDVNGGVLRADGVVQGSVAFNPNTNFVAISGISRHLLALTANNDLLATGNRYYGQTDVPAAATNIVFFAAGGDHSLVLREDGQLIAWGANFSGQLDAPAVASNVVAISAGGAHNLALSHQAGLPLVGPTLTRSTMLGQTAYLVANGQSAGPAQYQWQFNGQSLIGATNSALILSNLNWTNAGNYQVIISNALGVSTGSPTALTIFRTPLVFETNGVFAPSFTNEFRARVLGAAGIGPVIIFASTNLVDWVPVYTNPPVIGVVDFVEPAVGGSTRFYRAFEGGQ